MKGGWLKVTDLQSGENRIRVLNCRARTKLLLVSFFLCFYVCIDSNTLRENPRKHEEKVFEKSWKNYIRDYVFLFKEFFLSIRSRVNKIWVKLSDKIIWNKESEQYIEEVQLWVYIL